MSFVRARLLRAARIALAGAFALGAGGCASVGYYAQAIGGHLDLMRRVRPAADLIADPATDPALRVRLQRALEVRAFASAELALPDNGSYRGYADLGRPFAVWNVFAAPEFSVEPVQSCFLFAGCVAYRGFHAEADARAHAAVLAARGLDVRVAGVPAYSTLGWFDDPLLNTFIHSPEADLARLVFHELAHQVAYVKDDTVFNESFAVAVEEEGVRRWMRWREARDPAARESYRAWLGFQARRAEFIDFVLRWRTRLAGHYAGVAGEAERRGGRRRLFAVMVEEYETLKRERWRGFAGYDRILFDGGGPNNALLASIAAYSARVPAFRALLAQTGGDLRAFHGGVRDLARLPRGEREARLDALSSQVLDQK